MRITNSIEFEIAQHQLSEFEILPSPLIDAHREAIDCWDCQAFLQKGIAAYNWLVRLEGLLEEADAIGLFDSIADAPRDHVDVVRAMYKRWLVPCSRAEAWANKVTEMGFVLDNLAEFRDCCSLVKDWLDRDAWYLQSQRARVERLAEN